MELSWIAWIVPAICFMTALAGAYLDLYPKKKGENLATHEDMRDPLSRHRAWPYLGFLSGSMEKIYNLETLKQIGSAARELMAIPMNY